jgi:MFS family permease
VLAFGFSYAARDVVTPLIIAHCFGSRNLAQIYGVLMLTILIGPLGGTFAGWVHDQTGSYQGAFTALAATNAATFALLLAVRDERRV